MFSGKRYELYYGGRGLAGKEAFPGILPEQDQPGETDKPTEWG